MPTDSLFSHHDVAVPTGPRLALRRATGDPARRPFLFVHGLASNARLWDGVARRLVAVGHDVAAVDLRGHGLSEDVADGYSTAVAAADVAAVAALLGWTGHREPVVAGQSWGGNVVLELAAQHGGVAAVACLDGGWLRFGHEFADFDACWSVLAPPTFDGAKWADLVGWINKAHPDWSPEAREGTLANLVELPGGGVRSRLARAHHRDILRSLWDGDPRKLYPLITVPVLLLPAGSPESARLAPLVAEATAGLADAEVRWYDGADHDLHAQHPGRVAADLLALAERADS